ncbi:MAG: SurA N-terminal domain-containing protein [Phenylobacterium sp.]
MLSAIRTFAKSWVAAVLIGLLIVSFAVFGINDVFRGNMSDAVVQAGPRKVNSADFKREFDSQKGRIEQQMGQPIPLETAVANGLDRKVLDYVAAREAFAALLQKAGIRPSDKLLISEIQKIPAFFDQVSGRFDKESYQRRLADNGMTTEGFEQMMRDEIAEQHLGTAIVNGIRIPRAYSALAAIYGSESREVAYFAIDPATVPQPALPTDAQLTAFMKENAAQLTQPEFRVLTVVRFSPALIAGNLPVDEAELKKRYDFRKDTLSTPETRTLVLIPAKDAPTAQQIAARLAKGENPITVAKAVGVDAVTYENKPLSAVQDRKAGAAAFAMQPGQVGPVQGDLGVSVIKVIAVTPGKVVTLEEARPALEAEIRKDAAAEKVYSASQAYDDAHQAGSSLAEAAQKAGVAAITIGPLSQQGRDPQGQPVAGLTQKLVETAFALPAGGESEVTEAGQGEYFAVRVEKIIPPAMPPLAEIKPQLVRVWMLREIGKRMEARADELAARVRKGEALEAVAASIGSPVARIASLDRRSASQNREVSQEILAGVFTSKPGDVFVARNNRFGFVVGKLISVSAGEGPTLARMTEAARPQMTAELFRELEETARSAARQEMKVRISETRARAALGLEPLEPAKAAGKAEKAK